MSNRVQNWVNNSVHSPLHSPVHSPVQSPGFVPTQGYFCVLYTHGVQSSAFIYKPFSPPVFSYFYSMQIRMHGEGVGNIVTCSDVRRIRRKTHGSHCLTELIHNWSVHKTQQWGQTVLICSAQWVCHGINKLSYILIMCLFYPKELASIAMWRLVWDDTSPHRAARNTSLLHHSILTTYYHTDTMLILVLFSLDVLHTLWCS